VIFFYAGVSRDFDRDLLSSCTGLADFPRARFDLKLALTSTPDFALDARSCSSGCDSGVLAAARPEQCGRFSQRFVFAGQLGMRLVVATDACPSSASATPSVRCVYPNLPTADYAPLEATATDFAGRGRILWLTAGIQRIVSAQPVDHLLENGLILSSRELKTLPDI
jgi:hypothetical protein